MPRIVHTVFLFKMDKFKSLSKHKAFNEDGKEEKCGRGEFPLVYNEYKKRLTAIISGNEDNNDGKQVY